MHKHAISIVVPTLNEAENVPSLLSRIDDSMNKADIAYEVILVDDKSTDNTLQVADSLTPLYPLQVVTKRGKRGKAYSLLEGFKLANYHLIAMIDADLQYPPEEIAPMTELLSESDADLIVTRRVDAKAPLLRRLSTKVFNLLFARLLFGISFDTQSGLKLFRKRILSSFEMTPSPWSFDLEFIVRATEHKYKIASHDIPFDERLHGETKVSLLSTTFELAKASLGLKRRTSSSRLKEGVRANSRFLKNALSIAIATIGLSGLALAFTKPASALTLTPAITTPVTQSMSQPASIVGDVRDFFGGNSSSSQPTNAPASTPSTPAASPTASSKSSQSSSSSQSTPSNSTRKATTTTSSNGTNTRSAAKTTTAPSANTDSLSPATATNKKTSVYQSGYPYYTLSSATTQRFNAGAQAAIIAAVLCVGAVILFTGGRTLALVTNKTFKRS